MGGAGGGGDKMTVVEMSTRVSEKETKKVKMGGARRREGFKIFGKKGGSIIGAGN